MFGRSASIYDMSLASNLRSVPGRALLTSFDRLMSDGLKRHGFRGREGHYVRNSGSVLQVIELQVAVFGGRVTANLGLDLPWLRPATRWIQRPRLGPHAHEAVRWTRIGLVGPEASDQWWNFTEEGVGNACEAAAHAVGSAVIDDGLPWLEIESKTDAFLRHAEERVSQSKSPRHPHGRFSELRLLAAVQAWNGLDSEAKLTADFARSCWSEEKDRLSRARLHYRKNVAQSGDRVASVPDLVRELDQLLISDPASSEPAARFVRPAPRRSSPG
jgi:hypothetical protein